jgi:hypothetical protein
VRRRVKPETFCLETRREIAVESSDVGWESGTRAACELYADVEPTHFEVILSSLATGRAGSAMADGRAGCCHASTPESELSHITPGPQRGAYTTHCSRLRHGAFAEGKHGTVQVALRSDLLLKTLWEPDTR